MRINMRKINGFDYYNLLTKLREMFLRYNLNDQEIKQIFAETEASNLIELTPEQIAHCISIVELRYRPRAQN